MAPVRNYSSWNSRKEDTVEQIEPYQKFFFICEGANTETWYFRKLIDLKKSGINSKKNSEIGNLAEKVEIAICQEMNLNQDERQCSGQITSNIGKIIEEIRNHTIKM